MDVTPIDIELTVAADGNGFADVYEVTDTGRALLRTVALSAEAVAVLANAAPDDAELGKAQTA